MKRVTVDTNIFISATFWQGTPKQVINVFKTRKAVLVLSESILSELERKLNHKKFADELSESGLTVTAIVDGIRDMAELVLPGDIPEDAVRDPKDRIILACAVGGKADIIVSGDKDLLILKAYQAVSIMTAAEFLSMLASEADT